MTIFCHTRCAFPIGTNSAYALINAEMVKASQKEPLNTATLMASNQTADLFPRTTFMRLVTKNRRSHILLNSALMSYVALLELAVQGRKGGRYGS